MSLLDTSTACSNSKGTMGLSFGLQSASPKRKSRWLFNIPGVSAERSPALPPKKAGRSGITLKEFECHHISENIWYPLKAEWKTVNLTLYDIACNDNPVFAWLQNIYDPSDSSTNFGLIVDSGLLQDALLELYDGCGNVLESWTYQSCYPQSIDWGELEMGNFDIVTVDMILRYQRAVFSGS